MLDIQERRITFLKKIKKTIKQSKQYCLVMLNYAMSFRFHLAVET